MALVKQFLKTRPEVWVTFTVPQEAVPEAESCFLSGEFNDWELSRMTRSKDGMFRQKLKLAADQQYRFRYAFSCDDGKVVYENDWQADGYQPNGMGQEDSVVDLRRQ